LISQFTGLKQQSDPTSCLLGHQVNQISRLKKHKEDFCTLISPRTPKSSTKIKSPATFKLNQS
ncbi:unnamed protein product, partial [Hymenolepis diminuta]